MALSARQQQDAGEALAATLSVSGPLTGTTEASQQPAGADVADDPATPVAPVVKRGRRVDPEGRDAGDDTGMGEATQEKPEVEPPGS